MTQVTRKEVSDMANLLGALESIDDGKTPATSPNANLASNSSSARQVKQQMSGLLEALDNIDGNSDRNIDQYNDMVIEDKDYELEKVYGDIDADHHEKYTGKVRDDVPTFNGPKWKVVESSVPGMKSLKSYKVQNTIDGTVIFDNIMLYESAEAIVTAFKRGETLNNPRLLGIISMGIKYTATINEAIKASRERMKVLNESNYSRAQELDLIIDDKKRETIEIKQTIIKFLVDAGYIQP